MSKHILSHKEGDHNCIYELFAISNHYGSLLGGHYTAYCKNNQNEWYEFDDSQVSRISAKRIVTKAAYFLCYRKVKEL